MEEEEQYRSLEFGGEMEDDNRPSAEVVALSNRLKKFVVSESFGDVKRVIDDVVGRYAVPVPRREYDSKAYEVYNIVRDVMNELTYSIVAVADISKGEQ